MNFDLDKSNQESLMMKEIMSIKERHIESLDLLENPPIRILNNSVTVE